MATGTQIEINEPEHVYLNTTTEIPATELSIRSGPSVNRAALIRTCIVALFGGLLAGQLNKLCLMQNRMLFRFNFSNSTSNWS